VILLEIGGEAIIRSPRDTNDPHLVALLHDPKRPLARGLDPLEAFKDLSSLGGDGGLASKLERGNDRLERLLLKLERILLLPEIDQKTVRVGGFEVFRLLL